MSAIGRNAPCPCGSGKKYKKCCLVRDRPPLAAVRFERAVGRALDWLGMHHRREFKEVIEGFHRGFDERLGDAVDVLPDDILDLLTQVAGERLLAEAELPTRDGPRTAFELLIGTGGPPLPLEEREVLHELATRLLRVYEVVGVDPGRGLDLVDIVTRERFEVQERSASSQVEDGDVLAARLLHRQPGITLSGMLLPFPRAELQPLREGLRGVESELGGLTAAEQRRRIGAWVVDAWLEMLHRRSRPPEIVDAATGERVILTTDHYRVRDWDGLSAVLAAEADVNGTAEEGGWTRVAPQRQGDRVLLSLNVGRGDRLEVFARSVGLADEGRKWLEQLAGQHLSFRARDVVDPREVLQGDEPPTSSGPAPLRLSPEDHQAMQEQLYADWATQRIPALGDKSPRQAVRSGLGRERVVELLLSYEHEERKGAREESRPPADFGFLWRSVGLERPPRQEQDRDRLDDGGGSPSRSAPS